MESHMRLCYSRVLDHGTVPWNPQKIQCMIYMSDLTLYALATGDYANIATFYYCTWAQVLSEALCSYAFILIILPNLP